MTDVNRRGFVGTVAACCAVVLSPFTKRKARQPDRHYVSTAGLPRSPHGAPVIIIMGTRLGGHYGYPESTRTTIVPLPTNEAPSLSRVPWANKGEYVVESITTREAGFGFQEMVVTEKKATKAASSLKCPPLRTGPTIDVISPKSIHPNCRVVSVSEQQLHDGTWSRSLSARFEGATKKEVEAIAPRLLKGGEWKPESIEVRVWSDRECSTILDIEEVQA